MALIYCPECGRQVSDSAASCPGCGYPISSLNMAGKTNYRTAESMAEDYSKPESGKYNVFLTSALEEGVSATARILSDVLGYTYADALALATNLPTIVLYNVTVTQAKAAANALADYGLDVAVYDENGYVDYSDFEYDAEKTTTTENGTSVATALWDILKTVTVANLISRVSMRRYAYPFPYSTLFRPVRRQRFFFNPLFRYGYARPRPSLVESLLGLNRGRYGNYRYEPPRMPQYQYRSNYRVPGGRPPVGAPRPQQPRPSQPSGGSLFGSLFGSGSSKPAGGGSTIGGTSKPGMGHTASGSRSTAGGTRSSGSSSLGSFGSLFGSSKSSGFGHSTSGRSSGSSFGSSRPSGSSFGSSRSSGLGHSSGSSFGSRSGGSSFGGSRSSGGGGGRVGGGAKGGMGHSKH